MPSIQRVLADKWLSISALATFLVCVLGYIWPHPPLGLYVAMLGVFASIATVRGDGMTPKEKAVWVMCIFLLAVFEIRTQYRDRNEHDRQQLDSQIRIQEGFKLILQNQQAAFEAILKESQRQFIETITSARNIESQGSEAISQITGAGTFVYFSAVPNMGYGDPVSYPVTVWVRGKYPMREVTSVIQRSDSFSVTQNLLQPTLPIAKTLLPGVFPIDYRLGLGQYNIQTLCAAGGPINEVIRLRLVNGNLDQNIEVWGWGKQLYKLGSDNLGFGIK